MFSGTCGTSSMSLSQSPAQGILHASCSTPSSSTEGLRQAIQCVQQLLCRHFLRHEQDVVLSQPSRQGDTRHAQFLQRTVGNEQAVLFKFHFIVHAKILLYF